MVADISDSSPTPVPVSTQHDDRLQSVWTAENVLAQLGVKIEPDGETPIGFFHLLERLKTTRRTGWVRAGIRPAESIADHMYRMAVIAMVAPPGVRARVDVGRCAQMALVHDLAEAVVGDITPLDSVSKEEKSRRERETIEVMCSRYLEGCDDVATNIRDLWTEYEDGETAECEFVHEVDKIEMIVQAVDYERRQAGRLDLGEFVWAASSIKSDEMRDWVRRILVDRQLFWDSLPQPADGHTIAKPTTTGPTVADIEARWRTADGTTPSTRLESSVLAGPSADSLSPTELVVLTAIAAASVAVMYGRLLVDPLWAAVGFSGIAGVFTFCLIRWLRSHFVQAQLSGRDMAKVGRPVLPEAMGAVAAVVFLLAALIFIPILFFSHIRTGGRIPHTGRTLHQFPLNRLASYLSALLTVQSIVILGILDDVFDMRWRHKISIPAVSSIPLLLVYFVDYGVTSIVVPLQVRPYVGFAEVVDLGPVYYVYMALLTIFCTNSINILAGINGIEVLQSVVIAIQIMANNYFYLQPVRSPVTGLPEPHPAVNEHRLSLYLLLPFTAVSVGLLMHNLYPARVFVGDTYCYFAGTVFAVVGILGHFSKTLWLLFIPQAVNFVYSAPQLFGIVPCPRHRLPRFNKSTNRLEPSMFEVDKIRTIDRIDVVVQLVLRLLAQFRLVAVEQNDKSGRIERVSNLTLINWWLVVRGPLSERRLAWELAAVQAVSGTVGLLVQHRLSMLVFGRSYR